MFGIALDSKDTDRDAIRQVKRHVIDVDDDNITTATGGRYVTIISRRMRKFLNTNELVAAAHEMNFSHVRVADMYSLTVPQQVSLNNTI